MIKTTIVTDSLVLRLIEHSDLEAIHDLHAQPEVDQYNALGIPDNIQETRTVITPWIEDNHLTQIKNYTFAITHSTTKEFIGLFGLKLGHKKYKRAEVWYKLHPKYWNKGYATQAVKAVLNFGFETLKLHRIEAGTAVDNMGSIKVLEKSGMIREAQRRQILPLKSGWSDNFEYAILETDKR